ncbi:MAG TPA: hypothetical protein VGE43_05680, partial [Acidimicrobiales bacterium]
MADSTSRSPLTSTSAWQALAAHQPAMAERHLRDIFAGDPDRGRRMVVEAGDLYIDLSKHRVTTETMDLLVALARERDLAGRFHALFT